VRPALAIVATAAAVLAALLIPPILRRRRRRAAVAAPLPATLATIVDRNVPVRARLPAALRQRHDGLISAFLAEKAIVGCNGLEVTEEIRATIAAQACLLLLGREAGLYDELRSILVYPTAFWVEDEVEDDDGLVTRRRRVLSGEAWDSSRIVLSWEDIVGRAEAGDDGFNLALHEFAHYLEAEGHPLPPLPLQRERSAEGRVRAAEGRVRAAEGRVRATEFSEWSGDMAEEFNRLLDAVERGEETFLDPYGAEDESEFFAVATEEFYERPAELLARHPRLYSRLQQFYGIDPAAWITSS
jgi:Mlc titration factor MtfA (ptsG expression regulator)